MVVNKKVLINLSLSEPDTEIQKPFFDQKYHKIYLQGTKNPTGGKSMKITSSGSQVDNETWQLRVKIILMWTSETFWSSKAISWIWQSIFCRNQSTGTKIT